MAKDTKEKILEAALMIFARDGYAGTNIKDIAESVGIVKSALYRHFDSKEAIWDAVYEMTKNYYEEHFGSKVEMIFMPDTLTDFYDMTKRMVNFTIHDKKIIQMRKILLTEQFRSDRIRTIASHYFLYDTEEIFTKVFSNMIDKGSVKNEDPMALAFAFTSPITALIHLCDREPEKEAEVMERIESFTRFFIRTYGNENQE